MHRLVQRRARAFVWGTVSLIEKVLIAWHLRHCDDCYLAVGGWKHKLDTEICQPPQSLSYEEGPIARREFEKKEVVPCSRCPQAGCMGCPK